jgi:hypothetical protein
MIRALRPPTMGRLVGARWLLPAMAGLSLVTALGTLVQIVLVGHSGAQAAWSGVGSAGGR